LDHPLLIGVNEHAGEERYVTLSDAQRAQHMHIIGASGTGKSTLLLSLITQDLCNGKWPGRARSARRFDRPSPGARSRKRIDDVILFDPADEEFPVGFNILSAHSAIERSAASDLVAVFSASPVAGATR